MSTIDLPIILRSGQLKSGGVCSTVAQSAGQTCADDWLNGIDIIQSARIATVMDLPTMVIEVRDRRSADLMRQSD